VVLDFVPAYDSTLVSSYQSRMNWAVLLVGRTDPSSRISYEIRRRFSPSDPVRIWVHLLASPESVRHQGRIDLSVDFCPVQHILRTDLMDLCLLSIQLHSLNLRKTLLKNVAEKAKENWQERSRSQGRLGGKLRNLNMWSFSRGS
jgi:hypothetical protein